MTSFSSSISIYISSTTAAAAAATTITTMFFPGPSSNTFYFSIPTTTIVCDVTTTPIPSTRATARLRGGAEWGLARRLEGSKLHGGRD